ncbi:MAG: CoA-binding protein [Anaerolineae bacterium]|uniref:CoA-binding protein n=1 Tax=Thermoflexus sp. TaxID=1969742 RepID=UPI0025EBBB8B|nr:CoA-binding protein [Thermoflexus sp.]MCS7350532.1 CoA-binding protein [Thermoflexus sp.]MDW8179983.1 CoA-binding protein [Anaerolineae bacterium]
MKMNPAGIPSPRIHGLRATPMPDGRRVVVELELPLSSHPPELELILYNEQGEEVHSMAVMGVMELRPTYVLHLRRPDPGARYRVEARLLGKDVLLDRQQVEVVIPEPVTVQDDITLRHILTEARTIAVVGLSADPERPSHQVASYLQRQGYRIIPVNPTIQEVLGEPSYPDLLSVPEPVDVVDVFRPARYVPEIVEQAIAKGAKVIWMQLGVIHFEAAQRAREAGLLVVMDRCMKIEHQRLMRSK